MTKPPIDELRLAIDNALRRLSPNRRWPKRSRAGGERAAAIYSVIETAQLNDIELQVYIADIIEKIASGWPASRWDKLMPWNWQPADRSIAKAA